MQSQRDEMDDSEALARLTGTLREYVRAQSTAPQVAGECWREVAETLAWIDSGGRCDDRLGWPAAYDRILQKNREQEALILSLSDKLASCMTTRNEATEMTVEEQIENAVARGWTRYGLMPIYRAALVAEDAGEVIDWERINAAILTKFKKSGLAAIRDAAWWRAVKPEAVA